MNETSGRGGQRGSGSPTYLAGLLLHGRRVVVVGGGAVATRRVPKLLAAGARVELISPEADPALRSLAESGAVVWTARRFTASDLDGAWYVLAATDSAEVNAAVTAEAEQRHTFCVRADRADSGSAWTPATGEASGVTVAVITSHDPLRARRIRDRLVDVVVEEGL
ncbi:MAG: NAD(P)-dependent oxidoreductase [Micropruina sp.]|uniref:precorrin-2 dehydrogenase/sirohydrochlorin ferrochelatase family protein n=1 Tax=Micropruina sp. TaxID=2737536 RepID=UPI0039E48D75